VPLIPLIGHDAVRERLIAAQGRDRLPASLLLHGVPGIGKERLALWLAQRLLCEAPTATDACGSCLHCRYVDQGAHPDLQWYVPRKKIAKSDPDTDDILADMAEGIAERVGADRKDTDPTRGVWPPDASTHGYFVDTTRAIVERASLKPAMAARRVILVPDVELMVVQAGNDAAANAFLKLLEEPPPSTTILLTSSATAALLPTIRSRCVMMRVPVLTSEATHALVAHEAFSAALTEAGVATGTARRAQLAAGRPGLLLGGRASEDARHAATLLLEAARGAPVDRVAAAFRQGNTGARGPFSDALDALAELLRDEARAAADSGRDDAARRTAQAIVRVEAAKAEAYGNVMPTLTTAVLLEDIAPLVQ
jgi:DNA polymerase-3 subunit delta'